jgi:hypothetical protein
MEQQVTRVQFPLAGSNRPGRIYSGIFECQILAFHQAFAFPVDTAKLASFVLFLMRQCPGACSGVVY